MSQEIYSSAVGHPPQFNVGSYGHFNVEPLTGAIGAEITGLDVADAFSDASIAGELRAALTQHLVLLIPEQNLDIEGLRRFGQLFGNLQVNPVVKRQGDAGDVMLVKQEADEQYNFSGIWHSDVTWDPLPSGETALYAMELPDCGGDTHFANSHLAFDTLSSKLQTVLTGMRAVHELARSQEEFAIKKKLDADATGEQAKNLFAEHPVVRRHPLTGLPALYVCQQFTTRFCGMTEEESQPLLQTLFKHQVRPDFTCRIRWRKGSLAIWDNRSTIHYASNDYPDIRRVMMRVSTVGEPPEPFSEAVVSK